MSQRVSGIDLGDIDVADFDMPMLVRLQRLLETGSMSATVWSNPSSRTLVSLRPQQRLDRAAFVHRAITLRNLIE